MLIQHLQKLLPSTLFSLDTALTTPLPPTEWEFELTRIDDDEDENGYALDDGRKDDLLMYQ